MKRDRVSQIPVLHFNTSTLKDDFISTALPGTSVESMTLQTYGVEDPVISDENVDVCHYKDKSFLCVVSFYPANMCNCARHYNEVLLQQIPECDTILSIDKTGRFSGPFPRRHPSHCRFPENYKDVLRYLKINEDDIEDIAQFESQCIPASPDDAMRLECLIQRSMDMNPLLRMIAPVISNNNTNAIWDVNSNDRGPVSPVRERKKLKIHESWQEIVETPDVKPDNPDILCGVCYENIKRIKMPCGHAYYCVSCYKKALEDDTLLKTCPLCRKDYEDVNINTF